MQRHFLAAMLALPALAGCSAPAPTASEQAPTASEPAPSVRRTADASAPAPPVPASAVPASAVPAPKSLAGHWRVAGIDGAPLNEPYGLALSADAATIWWEPRCAGLVRAYRIDGAAIAVGPDPAIKPLPAGTTPRPVCLIAHPARLDDLARALDTATAIARTPSNGVELSGGGHSLLLFSQ